MQLLVGFFKNNAAVNLISEQDNITDIQLVKNFIQFLAKEFQLNSENEKNGQHVENIYNLFEWFREKKIANMQRAYKTLP